MNRRHLLKTGSAAAIVLGTSLPLSSAALAPPPPRDARFPWQQAGTGLGDPRLDALAYGVLAPNPHNKQPWVVELHGDDTLLVKCQLDRRLPMTDPPDRQTTIGLGAFCELTRMAAAASGYLTDFTPFPEGSDNEKLDDRPVAKIVFRPGRSNPDPLFRQVLRRRTNRSEFQDTGPDQSAVASVVQAGTYGDANASEPGSILDTQSVGVLKEIASDGWAIEVSTDRVWKESVDVTRVGRREVQANPDGIALEGFPLGVLRTLGVLSEDNMMKKDSFARNSSRNFYQKLIDTAQGFLTLTTTSDSREGQLIAGAQWLRMQLKATELGIAFHPLSQALQEFEEMNEPYLRLHDFLKPEGTVHMLARIGYAERPGPSPRWPLETRISKLDD